MPPFAIFAAAVRRVLDEVGFVQQIEVLVERQRRQQEVREPPGAGFDALETERGGGRARGHAADVGMSVDEHLEMTLPVAEILDLVQEEHPGESGASACLTEFLGELLDRQARVQRLVERDVGDIGGLVPTVAEQSRDDVVQQHRLAHAARTHEDYRAPDVGLLDETPEALEVGTSLQGPRSRRGCRRLPTTGCRRACGCGPALRESGACTKASRASRGRQLEKVDFA